MQGKILDYNNEFKSGLIRGEDDNKYRFSIDDCKSDLKPRANAEVDFEPNADKAVDVYVLTKDTVDNLKDVASSAVTATTNVAKEAVEKIKSIIPMIITLIILGSIGLAIWYVVAVYLPKQKEKKYYEELQTLTNEGNKLLKSGNFEDAISKFQVTKDMELNNPYSWRSSQYKSYRQCVNEGDGGCSDLEQYDFKIAQAYIGLKNPNEALQLLADPIADTCKANQDFLLSLGCSPNCEQKGCSMASNKAYYCSLASQAYSLKGDKESGKQYAELACDHGDCSLVKK